MKRHRELSSLRKFLRTSVALVPILAAAPAFGQTESQEPAATGAEIIVTGSRIARSGFDAPTPTKVVTSEAIEARGLSNIGEFLNELPSVRPSTGAQQNTQVPNGGQTYIDLRGLGNVRTLTLVDGRRFVPSSPTGQVDINLIPTIAIGRVDIVTGGASAAYGSDAISGVANLITDKNLQGFKGDVSVGITQYGDNEEFRAGLAFGTEFAEGRGQIMVAGEYFNSEGVDFFNDRRFGRDQPGQVSFIGPRPAGVPSRFFARGVQFVNLAYGGLIVGNNADGNLATGVDVLRGIQFGPGGVVQPFNYGGTQQVGTFAINFAGGNPGLWPQDGHRFISPIERRVALANMSFEVSDSVTLFAEGNYGRAGQDSNTPPTRNAAFAPGPQTIIIQRDNAFLPAQVGATIDAYNATLPPGDPRRITSFPLARANNDFGEVRNTYFTTVERIVGGFTADLGGTWKLDGYLEYGRSDQEQRTSNLRIDQNLAFAVDAVNVGGQIVCRNAAAAPAGCVPINLFGAGSPSAAAIDYVTGTIIADIISTQKVAALNIQGEPFSTWAGPVSVAAGVEYRKEKSVGTSDEISQRNGFAYGNPKPFAGSFDVKEAYFETIIPLAKDSAIGQSLEFNGAIRYTDYSSSGGITAWKAGLTYEPIPDIRFRATRSRDIRAPNNAEFFTNFTSIETRRNPFSGATLQIPVNNLANPTLTPEKSDTTTLGVVLRPRFIPGLSLSADFYEIKIDNAIAADSAQFYLDRCFAEITAGAPGFYCGFVSRVGTGPTTAVTLVSVPLQNIASLTARGVDFEATYRLPVGSGEVGLQFSGNYTKDLITDDGFGVPRTFNAGIIQTVGSVIDRAGQVGGGLGAVISGATSVPHWTLNGSVSYKQGGFTGTLNGRYVGGGAFDRTLVGPDDPDYNAASPISIDDNKIQGRFYLNLSGQIDVVSDGRRKLQFYGVVNNLTNRQPPFPGHQLLGFYDRAGRSFKVGARFAY